MIEDEKWSWKMGLEEKIIWLGKKIFWKKRIFRVMKIRVIRV